MEAKERLTKHEKDVELNEALQETFPASDAIATGEATSTKPDRPVHRRPAQLDKALVEQLAKNVAAKHAD